MKLRALSACHTARDVILEDEFALRTGIAKSSFAA
jgi:hypothetical protein